MRANHSWLKRITKLGLLLMMGASMNANSSTMRWKEEVLLHDSSKIIAKRTQKYGKTATLESHEPQLLEEVWEFKVPGTEQEIEWRNDFNRDDPNSSMLMLLIVDFLNGIPYLATSPAGCISYNKWGRPNPPYVFFKYDGKAWQRIQLAEFPLEFKTANVVVGRPGMAQRQMGMINADAVNASNGSGLSPDLRAIVREPIKTGLWNGAGCEEMIFYKCGWISPNGTFGRDLMDRTCKRHFDLSLTRRNNHGNAN